MKMTRNGDSRSIASPTTNSRFFSVSGFDTKSLLTRKLLQNQNAWIRKKRTILSPWKLKLSSSLHSSTTQNYHFIALVAHKTLNLQCYFESSFPIRLENSIYQSNMLCNMHQFRVHSRVFVNTRWCCVPSGVVLTNGPAPGIQWEIGKESKPLLSIPIK